ncbi:hypothetical protein [Iningainema tapete]|uniref:Uncharacterized protein n=1 Tax=Iningainema tapete BLCC-T55 TaxID=2748662 RepID=A0A8J6XG63_9CYAN|nr:hypothetical protein [Iningainema tapete]MBD2771416.1 hypothetical protein [Iningainema tapete BLCC-T55]
MKVKALIEALQNCHPDAEINFCVNFDVDEGALVAVEYEVNYLLVQGESNPIGTVYLHNTKDDFVHDKPLLKGNLFHT